MKRKSAMRSWDKSETRHSKKQRPHKGRLTKLPEITEKDLAWGRREYALRRARWYPTNTDSQIPGSRRGIVQ